MIDAWLLSLFPGRMLEELDQMDLNRLIRARVASNMQRVEARRQRFLAGEIEAKDIDADDWALIGQMDDIADSSE